MVADRVYVWLTSLQSLLLFLILLLFHKLHLLDHVCGQHRLRSSIHLRSTLSRTNEFKRIALSCVRFEIHWRHEVAESWSALVWRRAGASDKNRVHSGENTHTLERTRASVKVNVVVCSQCGKKSAMYFVLSDTRQSARVRCVWSTNQRNTKTSGRASVARGHRTSIATCIVFPNE